MGTIVLIFCSFWLACGSAQAEKRVALVIGNSAYKNVPQLPNPANDAALLGGMLRRIGFDFVEIKTDLNIAECAGRSANLVQGRATPVWLSFTMPDTASNWTAPTT